MSDWYTHLEGQLFRWVSWLETEVNLHRRRDSVSCLILTGFTLPIFLTFLIMPVVAISSQSWMTIFDWQFAIVLECLLFFVCFVQTGLMIFCWRKRQSAQRYPNLLVAALTTMYTGLYLLLFGYDLRDSPLMLLCLSQLLLVRGTFPRQAYRPAIFTFAVIFVLHEIAFWSNLIPKGLVLNAPIYVGEALTGWWEFWLRIIYCLTAFPSAAILFLLGIQLILEKRRLESMVITDSLTGLANRKQFMRALAIESRRQEQSRDCSCVLMCDVDKFKAINDTWGHPAGDRVIQKIGQVLQRNVRYELDTVARVGGEEFVVILPQTSLLGGKEIAERICQQVRELKFHQGDETFRVSLSIGVARIENGQGEEGVKTADRLLYCAKSLGRNCVVVERPYMDQNLGPQQG